MLFKNDIDVDHKYSINECGILKYAFGMHFKIKSSNFLVSLIKFIMIMIALWILVPVFVVYHLYSIRGEMKNKKVCGEYFGGGFCDKDLAMHCKAVAFHLAFIFIAPILIAKMAFTHINKQGVQQ